MNENIKKETVNTVNDVKETIKNVNIKQDTAETKSFIVSFYTNPLGTLKQIIEENSDKYLKHTIIILIIWVVAAIITRSGIIFNNITWDFGYIFGSLFKNTIDVFKSMIEPILSVLTVSIILFLFKKYNRKKLTTIITAVTTAYIPVAISQVAKILLIISSDVDKLTNTFGQFCSAITIILTYFVAKDVLGIEKHSEFIKKFLIIEAIHYAVYFLLLFLGINI